MAAGVQQLKVAELVAAARLERDAVVDLEAASRRIPPRRQPFGGFRGRLRLNGSCVPQP